MAEQFTKEETHFAANVFNNIKVSLMAPDTIGLAQTAQSIVSKMTVLTEQEQQDNGRQTSTSDGTLHDTELDLKRNRNGKATTAG